MKIKLRYLIVFFLIVCPIGGNSLSYGAEPPSRDALIDAIIQVESGGKADAVGDNGKAVGVLQIHKVMVDDCNRILGENKYSYEDRKDPAKSRAMFIVYTNHYSPSWDPETVARNWNGGPKGHKKEATKSYWEKVQKLLGR